MTKVFFCFSNLRDLSKKYSNTVLELADVQCVTSMIRTISFTPTDFIKKDFKIDIVLL